MINYSQERRYGLFSVSSTLQQRPRVVDDEDFEVDERQRKAIERMFENIEKKNEKRMLPSEIKKREAQRLAALKAAEKGEEEQKISEKSQSTDTEEGEEDEEDEKVHKVIIDGEEVTLHDPNEFTWDELQHILWCTEPPPPEDSPNCKRWGHEGHVLPIAILKGEENPVIRAPDQYPDWIFEVCRPDYYPTLEFIQAKLARGETLTERETYRYKKLTRKEKIKNFNRRASLKLWPKPFVKRPKRKII